MNKIKLTKWQRDSVYKYLFGPWRTKKELGLILFPNAKNPESSISQHLADGKSDAIISYFLEQMVVVDPNSAIVELANSGVDDYKDGEIKNDLLQLAVYAEKYLSNIDENAWSSNIIKAADMVTELSAAARGDFRVVGLLLKGIGVLLQITDKPSFEALEQISESLERAILSCQLNIHNKELQGEVQTVQNVFFSKMSEVWKHALENPEYVQQGLAIYSRISGEEFSENVITKLTNAVKGMKRRKKSYTPLTNFKRSK